MRLQVPNVKVEETLSVGSHPVCDLARVFALPRPRDHNLSFSMTSMRRGCLSQSRFSGELREPRISGCNIYMMIKF